MGYFNGELRFWLGWAQQVGGDHAAAQESWRHAQSELKRFLQEQPENYNLMHDLALVEMGLGNKAAALSMAERAIATNPIEKDVVDGPAPIEILARVAAQAGEPDRASPPYRNCSRYRMRAHYLWATRHLLLPCSDSIQCLIHCAAIRASRNSSPRWHRNRLTSNSLPQRKLPAHSSSPRKEIVLLRREESFSRACLAPMAGIHSSLGQRPRNFSSKNQQR